MSHQRRFSFLCTLQRQHPPARHDSDYFLELAHEDAADDDDTFPPAAPTGFDPDADDTPLRAAAARRSMSRASFSKRHSLPPDAVRPSTSGGNMTSRPPSRLDTLRASTGLFHNNSEGQRRHSLAPASHYDDTSSADRTRRFSSFVDRSPLSPRQRPRSPEASVDGRRRASSGTAIFGSRYTDNTNNNNNNNTLFLAPTIQSQDSPTDVSEQPQTDSSVDSQPQDTVWDELDELKLRIKKLESGHKKPALSAAASGDSGDRPRTATTAPTTITSSPKQSHNPPATVEEEPKSTPSPPATEQQTGSLWGNVHPLLHDALSKSKDNVSSTVYHNLEVVAADAMNLAALTGAPNGQNTNSASPQPQPTPFNERQVRRRVDNLCRNLTDLCISLRESKPPASPSALMTSPGLLTPPAQFSSPSYAQSPVQIEHPASDLPLRRSVRKIHLTVSGPNAARPMSRLEQRKTSLLGPQAATTAANLSPRGSQGDLSGSESHTPPSHNATLQPPHRLSAAPSRALRSRMQNNHDGTRNDEERSLRAPSRAMTEFSNPMRATNRLAVQDRSPGSQRTPSLRDTLANRRKYDTSPVPEEDDSSPLPQPRTRIVSAGHAYSKGPSRTSSLIRSKHLLE